MPKPRMTKSEKAFVREIQTLVFATPEIRNGQSYLDRKTFGELPKDIQATWLRLVSTKTFQEKNDNPNF